MTDTHIARALAMAALTAVLAACQPAGAPADNAAVAAALSNAEATAIVDRAEASFSSGDARQIMANYTPDAVFFDPSTPEPTSDHATAMKWTEAFAGMKLSGLTVANRRIQPLDADTIISSGTATFSKSAAGQPVPTSIHYSNVYEKQADGGWKIVHEHLSIPAPAPAAAG